MIPFLFLYYVLGVSFGGVACARILFHIPTPTYSHNVVYAPIIKELVKSGHQVVSITTEPMRSEFQNDNLTEINVGFVRDVWKSYFDTGTNNLTMIQTFLLYDKVMNQIADMQLSYSPVKALIDDPNEHFDLLVMEWVQYFPIYGWAYRFQAPLVGMVSLDAFYDGHDVIGNPTHPYIISNTMLDFVMGPQITFWQRMRSIYYSVFCRLGFQMWGLELHNQVLRKHFGQSAPSAYDLAKNVSLVFLNQNHVINRRPTVPNCIFMNMVHIREPRPLPKTLREFFDNRTQQVIYFSLGSNVKSSSLPSEKVEIFIEVFSKLPYNVLWKWEQNHLPGQPPNVKLCKWCPQQDILAESGVSLFIMQGGIQSIDEAIHYRVPVLGIPFIIDQRQNILNLKSHGAAELMEFDQIEKNVLHNAIMKMMNDHSYKRSIDRLANLIEDQPMKPVEQVIWWLEYVLRHKGAEHLRAPILPWFLHLMLDAIMVAFLSMALLSYVACRVFAWLLAKFNRAPHRKVKNQ